MEELVPWAQLVWFIFVFVFVSFVSLASLTRKGWMVELAARAQFVSPLPSSPKSLPRVELSYHHRLFLHLKLWNACLWWGWCYCRLLQRGITYNSSAQLSTCDYDLAQMLAVNYPVYQTPEYWGLTRYTSERAKHQLQLANDSLETWKPKWHTLVSVSRLFVFLGESQYR